MAVLVVSQMFLLEFDLRIFSNGLVQPPTSRSLKINMEPKHRPIEKSIHLANLHFWSFFFKQIHEQ